MSIFINHDSRRSNGVESSDTLRSEPWAEASGMFDATDQLEARPEPNTLLACCAPLGLIVAFSFPLSLLTNVLSRFIYQRPRPDGE